MSQSNLKAGLAFKNRVLLYLLLRGLPVSDPTSGKTLSELLDNPTGDIAGLLPWIVEVQSSNSGDISTALNQARLTAQAAGSDWYLAIVSRRGHTLDDTYAVLPLSLAARILAGEAPQIAASREVESPA